MWITQIFSVKSGYFSLFILIVNIVINIFVDRKEFTNRIIVEKKFFGEKYVG